MLTGTSHKYWINELRLNPDDPHYEVIGTEFLKSFPEVEDGAPYVIYRKVFYKVIN